VPNFTDCPQTHRAPQWEQQGEYNKISRVDEIADLGLYGLGCWEALVLAVCENGPTRSNNNFHQVGPNPGTHMSYIVEDMYQLSNPLF